MADGLLEGSALSAFCGSVQVMLAAGIQTDEAVHMLAENRSDSRFRQVCAQVYEGLIAGGSLASSMEATGAFPRYAIDMVTAGEASGRLEGALHNLDHYYDEEDRLFQRLRTSVSYPAALLCVMAVILAFTVAWILPVFVSVYQSMTGSLTSGSFAYVGTAIALGWVALALTLAATALVLATMAVARTEAGRERIMAALERMPLTRDAMYQVALSRFSATIATYVSAGVTTERAMADALATVSHQGLKAKLQAAYQRMVDVQAPRSLVQALTECEVYEPIYARMLTVGSRSGSLDDTLEHLSDVYFDDAVNQMDLLMAKVEPLLAGFLTLTVGGTLIAVMLPLVGIMMSIG